MRFFQIATVFCFFSIITSCVSTRSDDELSWLVNYTLPLLNERLTVSMLGLESQNIDNDTNRYGDTLFIKRIDTLKYEYYSTLFTIPYIHDQWYTGSLVLKKLPKIDYSFLSSFAKPFKVLHKSTINNTTFSDYIWIDSVSLGSVDHISFDNTTKPLSAIVKNVSGFTETQSITLKLISHGDTISFNEIASLRPGESTTIQASLCNKTVGSNIQISCQAKFDIGKVTDEKTILTFQTDFNGSSFSAGLICDSLISLDFKYKTKIPFGQKGFDAGHIDISSFKLPFIVKNSLPVTLKVNASIDNVWNSNYCKKNGIKTLSNLSKFTPDSQYFKGNDLISINISPCDDNPITSNHFISFNNARVFPDWNATDTINTITIKIDGTIIPSGKWISIDDIKNTGLNLNRPEIDISSIYGAYVTEKRFENAPTKIPLLAQSSTIDLTKKLKNRLIPEKTEISIKIQFQLPDSTSFKAIELFCALYETDTTELLDKITFKMENIKAEKIYTHDCSFNNILRKLPDSLGYLIYYIIKPYDTISLDNKVLQYQFGELQLKFDMDISLDLKMYLVWGVTDTIRFAFNRKVGSFPISKRYIELMEDKELALSVLLSNNSNIVGRLSAFSKNASEKSTSEIIKTQLLGNGLLLPVRGKAVDNSITFNQNDISNLTSPESLDINWTIDLFPCETDALKDTDYIEINAEMILKGKQSTGSILAY